MSTKTRSPAKKAGTSKTAAKSEPIELSDSSETDGPQVSTSRAAGNNSGTASKKSTPKAASKATISNTNGKRKAIPESDSDDVKPAKKRASLGGASKPITAARKKSSKVVDSEDDEEYKDDDLVDEEGDDDEADDVSSEEEEDVKPKKKAPASKKATVAKKPAPAKKAPAAKPPSKTSTSKPSSSKTKVEDEDEEPKPKPRWIPKGPSVALNPGTKTIPEGAPDALGGLTIVFTGELESLARDEATTLAKRYGAKVTTSVSSKTSYVVLGLDAGPKKLDMIKKNKIKTLTEDEFLDLIATRGSKDLSEDYIKKQKEEEKKIKETAKAMAADTTDMSNSLWTVKYAPRTIKELCGNPGIVTKLTDWLEAWPKNAKSNFMKPGKDGSGVFRAALLSGPPGIGKTTTAHLVAKQCGYKVIEMNASDTRNKKLLEQMLTSTLDNTVLDGFLTGKPKDGPLDLSDRSCLIMDEVDGTSGGDRGGIGALNALIKKTKVPIICIANDRSLQKMKPLQATTLDLRFRRPDANMIRSRLMSIAFKEGIKIDKTVADQLVLGTQSDIRQIINILSTWKLNSNTMSFDQTKQLTDARDTNSLATPFALLDKLFGPYAWSATSKARISDKLEVYFQEFDMLPLFVQENYLKHKYARASAEPNRAAWKKMQLTSQAADSISDGDLVDRMIHGTQQHWSLMPVHGMLSTVLPAYYCYGTGSFGGWGGGENARAFPAWFGKNSTQGRLARSLTDIQIHMRLKVSGDKREIRQSYIPALSHKLVQPLVDRGSDAIEDVINEMDEYYLSKDEWDAIVEMGIGENSGDPLLKKIPAATKSAFTRKYNTSDHPIPFHKATEIAMSKKMPAAEKPDLEEAFEVEIDVDPAEDEVKKPKKGEDENTIRDKLVKAKKPKAAPDAKSKAATTSKAAASKGTASKAAPKGKAAKK